MGEVRSVTEFQHIKIAGGARSWQIDLDTLGPPLDDGGWEDVLAREMVDLAEAHEDVELICWVSVGPSVEFGRQGYSAWVAFAGPGPMIKACGDIIEDIVPSHAVRRAVVDASQTFQPRIRVVGGKVWIPLDASSWTSLDRDSGQASGDDEFDSTAHEKTISEGSAADAPAKAKRRHAAHSDVKVSYYQRKVERELKLPEGSVKFINPDGSYSKGNQLIGNLRARWEK